MNLIRQLLKYIAFRIVSIGNQYITEKNFRKLKVGQNVVIYDVSFEGNIQIGDYTYINERSRIDTGPNSMIQIGKHCAIGRNVHITAKTHDLYQPTTDEVHETILHRESDIQIGDYVWIGDNVVVTPGVTIGDRAVVGANSLVSRDIKPFEIVGGTPIRHIRFNRKHYKWVD